MQNYSWREQSVVQYYSWSFIIGLTPIAASLRQLCRRWSRYVGPAGILSTARPTLPHPLHPALPPRRQVDTH